MAKQSTDTATDTGSQGDDKQIATVAPAALHPVNTQLPAATAGFELFEGHAGSGLENVTAKDVLIPRLTLVQSLSEQVKKRSASFIEGAEIGDIVDVGTNELMPRPLHVLPVLYEKNYLEWAPRASGKGLVMIHVDADILRDAKMNDKGKPILPNGNMLVETAQIFLLNLSAGRRPSFLPFASTQLKKSRRWMTLAQGERMVNSAGVEFTPPLFYRSYFLGTAMESNAQGEWASWTIERGPSLPELPNWQAIMASAVAFKESVMGGKVEADTRGMEGDTGPIIEGEVSRAEGRM